MYYMCFTCVLPDYRYMTYMCNTPKSPHMYYIRVQGKSGDLVAHRAITFQNCCPTQITSCSIVLMIQILPLCSVQKLATTAPCPPPPLPAANN